MFLGLDWDLHCIQNWASVCLYPTPIHPDCYLFCGRFQGWLLQLWCSSCWLLAEGCEFADGTEMGVEKQPL